MKTTITPDELKALVRENKELVILDVRRKADYEAEKHLIPGAVWRDPEQIESWSADIPKDREVALYCVKGGSASQSVADRLRRQNVKACYVAGGLKAWRESGGEVTP